MVALSAGMSEPASICWLCARPLGRRIPWHHPVPKSRGGKAVVALHPICHRILHAAFSNTELARLGADPERLRSELGIARFLAWVASKPPDFRARTARRR